LSDPSLKVRKAALRTSMLEHRAAIAATYRETAAVAVAGHVETLLCALPARVISAYWPLDDELDPRPCLSRLAAAGHVLALPRMRGREAPLAFHRWYPDEPLIEGRFKVMEPSSDAPEVEPAVVLAPLLAFDRHGRRLGYGKGFYDRTLAGLRARDPGMLAVGLGLAAQEADEVPADDSDERLDAIVTENGVLHIAADLNERIASCGRRA